MNVQFFRAWFYKSLSSSRRKPGPFSIEAAGPGFRRNDRWGGRLKFISLLSICYLIFLISPVKAEDTPPELQGSGRPIPRFVTIDTDKAYVRSGPAPRYPVKWVYRKNGLPVEITQEFDVWRKIKDRDGDEGWINKALLSDKRGVIIKSQNSINLHEGFTETSRVMAHLENGVIAKLEKCTDLWCQISTGGYHGWVQRNFLWGLYPKEEIH